MFLLELRSQEESGYFPPWNEIKDFNILINQLDPVRKSVSSYCIKFTKNALFIPPNITKRSCKHEMKILQLIAWFYTNTY